MQVTICTYACMQLGVIDLYCSTLDARLKYPPRRQLIYVSLTGHPGIGSRLCIYWPAEQNWYSGQVTAVDGDEGLSRIQYDDGEVQWLHLAVECYMQAPAGGFAVYFASITWHSQCLTWKPACAT